MTFLQKNCLLSDCKCIPEFIWPKHLRFCCFVADVENGFYMLSLLDPVREDNVSIECKANRFAFIQPTFYKIENNVESEVVAGSDVVLLSRR